MEIFEVNEQIVIPTTEILLIEPFKTIWERDKTEKKSFALKEFSYIEFMVSPKDTNVFFGYPEEIRSEKIIENIFDEKYIPDPLVELGIEKYTEWKEDASPSFRYYKALLKSVESTRKFLHNVDLEERDDKGKPIHKINDVLNAQVKANDVLKNLHLLKKKVIQELFESSKTKGGKDINVFER